MGLFSPSLCPVPLRPSIDGGWDEGRKVWQSMAMVLYSCRRCLLWSNNKKVGSLAFFLRRRRALFRRHGRVEGREGGVHHENRGRARRQNPLWREARRQRLGLQHRDIPHRSPAFLTPPGLVSAVGTIGFLAVLACVRCCCSDVLCCAGHRDAGVGVGFGAAHRAPPRPDKHLDCCSALFAADQTGT